MKTIRVTVKKGGKYVIAAEGYAGSECTDATRGIEAAMGVTVTDVPTTEMYNEPVETERGVNR